MDRDQIEKMRAIVNEYDRECDTLPKKVAYDYGANMVNEVRQQTTGYAAQTPTPHPATDPRGWAHDICQYHKPNADGVQRINAIGAAAENLIVEILRSCPDCEDKLSAVRRTRVAMMFAKAAIALEGRV